MSARAHTHTLRQKPKGSVHNFSKKQSAKWQKYFTLLNHSLLPWQQTTQQAAKADWLPFWKERTPTNAIKNIHQGSGGSTVSFEFFSLVWVACSPLKKEKNETAIHLSCSAGIDFAHTSWNKCSDISSDCRKECSYSVGQVLLWCICLISTLTAAHWSTEFNWDNWDSSLCLHKWILLRHNEAALFSSVVMFFFGLLFFLQLLTTFGVQDHLRQLKNPILRTYMDNALGMTGTVGCRRYSNTLTRCLRLLLGPVWLGYLEIN